MHLFENEFWALYRQPPSIGMPGWVMLASQRHVAGAAYFDDDEAYDFGPALRHFSKVLEEVTGALRIYVAAMGEAFPHFHMHLIPRYSEMPNDVKGWPVFDLFRATGAGEVPVDEAAIATMASAYSVALKQHPPSA
jgi:diadenosine tetraphosphate (Ap4A) HIT family hydrolase